MTYNLETIENQLLQKIFRLRKSIINYNYKNFNNYYTINENIYCIKEIYLGSRQFDIIYNIIENDCNTLTMLSKKLNLSKSSLSIIIGKMTKQNLLEKSYSKSNDSRKVILNVTPIGLEYYYFIKDSIKDHLLKFHKSLNKKELKVYENALSNFTIAFKDYDVYEINQLYSKEKIAELIFHNFLSLKIHFENFLKHGKISIQGDVNLTKKEFEIISNMKESNIHTPSELTKLLYSSESTISIQLKSLVKKNFLKKEKHPKDSRKTLFYITKAGNDMFNTTNQFITSQLLDAINVFSYEKKQNLLNGIDALLILFELISEHN